MTDKDPVEQAEEILADMSRDLLAETIKAHGEMVLLTAITQKPVTQASLLFKASSQGIDYMTGMIVAVGLTARNWGRMLAEEPDLDFTKYIDPDAEEACEGDRRAAHRFAEAVLRIETVPDTDKVRAELCEWYEAHDSHTWGAMYVHLVHLFGELVETVLSARNGEYLDDSDDR